MKVISVTNLKGGVGKTNTAINLAAALAIKNKKVLLIDCDPQGNTSRGLGFDAPYVAVSFFDVILDKKNINKAIKRTSIENLYLIPTYMKYSYSEEYGDNYSYIKEALSSLEEDYDFVIIDTPPSLGFLTTNCFVASDSVLIPVQCEYFALSGVTRVLAYISNVQSKYNPSLSLEGILLNMFDENSDSDVEIANEIRETFKDKTYATRIPRSKSIPESNNKGLPVLVYRPTSRASISYLSLAIEVLDNN